MTQVDFYIIDGADAADRAQFACRLAERACDAGQRVYLHTADAAQTRWLDELLWTFRADSFVAHAAASDGGGNGDAATPLLLGHDAEPAADREVLINLASEVPAFFSRFPRLLEIIADVPSLRAAGRARYAYYKERGYPLRHHHMESQPNPDRK